MGKGDKKTRRGKIVNKRALEGQRQKKETQRTKTGEVGSSVSDSL